MSRWIWIIIAVCVSTAVYFTIRYGLRPKAIPVLNPTQFEQLEQIGIVIYKRLRQNIRAERMLVLGSSLDQTAEDARIWQGLIKAMGAEGEKYVLYSGEESLKSSFLEDVRKNLRANKTVVVQGLTPQVSHFMDGSLSRQLEKVARHPVLAISVLRLALDRKSLDELQTSCLDTTVVRGQQRLDCAAQKVARKYLKRKLDPENIWAVMERHGLKEFLLFVHKPAASLPAAE